MSTTTAPARPQAVRRPGDRIFGGAAVGSGVLILITLAAVAAFLLYQAWPAIVADPTEVRGEQGLLWYVGPLIFGTLLSSVIAC